jgi:hypothetical protein
MSEAGRLDKILNEREPKAEPVEADDIVEMPEPGAPYQAFARPSNKPVYILHCLLGKDGVESFEYVQKSDRSRFMATENGQAIKLRFAGTKIWDVTITGLNLWRLYDLIGQHRMAWIRLSDNGFGSGKDGEPVITLIKIRAITPEELQAEE